MSKIYTETKMQALLLNWVMTIKKHHCGVTNSTVVLPWEADLLSVTKSGYLHEFEIKVSKADYARDQKSKPFKFMNIKDPIPSYWQPSNYFWYATCEGFEIDPPEFAGWVVVSYNERGRWYDVTTKKEAPRLHKNKLSSEKMAIIARLLSYRLLSELIRPIETERDASA